MKQRSLTMLKRVAIGVIVIAAALVFIPVLINNQHWRQIPTGQEADASLADRSTLMVAIDQNYPPHEFVENGEAKGFNVDLVSALAEKAGYQIQFVPMPWESAYQALLVGDVDLVFMASSLDRWAQFELSDPIIDIKLAMFVRREDTGFTKLEDLNGHTVSVERGDISESLLIDRAPDVIIFPVEHQGIALKLLVDREVEVFFGNEYTGKYFISRQGIKDVKTIGEQVHIGTRVLAARKGQTELIARMNSALAEARASGEYDELVASWYGREVSVAGEWLVPLGIAAVLLLLFAIAATGFYLWSRALQRQVKERTEALEKSEYRYRGLVEQIPLGVVTCDLDKRITFANQPAVELLGVETTDQLYGRCLHEFADPPEAHQIEKWIDQLHENLHEPTITDAMFRRTSEGQPMYLEIKAVRFEGVQGFLLLLADVSQRVQHVQALIRTRDRLTLIHDIDRSILAARSPEDIALVALENIHKLIPFTQASVLLFDPARGGFLELATLMYAPYSETSKKSGIWSLNSSSIEVLTRGTTFMVPDIYKLQETSTTISMLVQQGVRSFFNVPLRTQDEFIGFLNMSWNYPNAFNEEDVEIANQLITSLGVAIRQAHLVKTEHRHRQAAESLQEVTTALVETLELEQVLEKILDYLRNVVSYESISVFLRYGNELQIAAQRGFRNESQLKVVWRTSELKHIADLFASRKPIIIPNVHEDPRWVVTEGSEYITSWMGVPLLLSDRVVGLLNLDHTEVGYYTQEDARVVMAFANQAAIAIENARLFEQTQKRLKRLTALRTMERAINSSLDLRETLSILLDQISQLLQVDASWVLLLDKKTNTLNSQARRGFRTGSNVFQCLKVGESLGGKAVVEDRIIHISDLTQIADIPVHRALVEEEGFVAYMGAPLKAKSQVVGVLELWHRSPLTPDWDWMEQFEILAGQAAIAIDNAMLFQGLQRFTFELEAAYDHTLEGWARALELRDRETEGHTRRVIDLTISLSEALGIAESDLVHIRRGALLHDIGKMGIPDYILMKPGPLSEEEWELMKRHPVYAYELLQPIPFLRPALDIPYAHHERWDGSGYPQGLMGEEIPLAARIFAVVDVWDALLSNRPYRPAWTETQVRDYLQREAGKLFDPTVVAAFLKVLDESKLEAAGYPARIE